jgi:hypothetical protein
MSAHSNSAHFTVARNTMLISTVTNGKNGNNMTGIVDVIALIKLNSIYIT